MNRLRALKCAAKIVEVTTMAVIEGVTLTTTTTYAQSHEEERRVSIMGLVDDIHFYKSNKADTFKIVQKYCSELLKMHGGEEWNCVYDNQVESLESAPYPSIEAMQNVFALGVKHNPEIQEFNPLALWDRHYVKEVEDSGYSRKLYA